MAKTDLNLRPLLGLLLLAAVLLMATLRPALAADSAGAILAMSGKADILRGAEKLAATSRTALYAGDTIVTGDGQVQIRFIDGTMLTLYRDTRFAVDDYRYGKGKGDIAHFSLLEGLMHTLTGQVDKQNYLLKTRLANLGVRGTEYSVRLADTLHVSVDQGRVVIVNAGGSIQVGAGGNATVTGQNAMPQPSGSRIDLRALGGAGRPAAGAGSPPPPAGGGMQGLGNMSGTPAPMGGSASPPPPGTQTLSSRQPPQVQGQQQPGQQPPGQQPPGQPPPGQQPPGQHPPGP